MPDRGRRGAPAASFHIPRLARAIVRLIQLVPALVATAFAGWAIAAALAGSGTIAAAATLMSLLALSVAVRARMSPDLSPERSLDRRPRAPGRCPMQP